MKRKVIAVGALLAALLAGGYTVQAGPAGKGDRAPQPQVEAGRPGCRTQMGCREDGCLSHFAKLADGLGLNEEQRQEIEALIKAQQEGNAPLLEKIAAGRRELMEAARSGEADEAKITELAEAQGKLMSELMVSRVRVKSQIFALLTPEQQKEAEAFCDGCDGGPGFGNGPGCRPRCGNGQNPGPSGGAAAGEKAKI